MEIISSENKKIKPDDYNTPHFPTWCPGCGNFAIWAALKNALTELKLPVHRVIVVFGIGCSGNFNNFLKAYVFHALHGRALPVGVGAKLSNHELDVIVIGGDGDGYAEGLNHFVQTLRTNINITYLVHNNHVYSLTTGQASPTSVSGFKSKTTPAGAFEYPLNPLALAVSAGGSFIARGFAGDIPHLTGLIKQGIIHKGFSYIDIMQPCPTFNPDLSYDWYRKRVYKLDETGYVADNRFKAWEKSQEPFEQKIPTGVFYREDRPILEQNYPQLAKKPLTSSDLDKNEWQQLLENYR